MQRMISSASTIKIKLMLALIFLPFMTALFSSPATGFLQRQVTLHNNEYCYQIFVPKNFTPKQKWPVLLFLHGAGERGSDCSAQTEIGLGPLLAQQRDTFPAIVVMPQCRPREVWFGEMEQYALLALEQTLAEFNGDRSRVYLTGLSMGGYGTFYLAARNPNKFAALLPICGGVVPPRTFPFPPHVAAQIPQD
ncbi:MAG: alpha/beta hydrolase-fold protein, partial [candidate division KSB1 bacterium]